MDKENVEAVYVIVCSNAKQRRLSLLMQGIYMWVNLLRYVMNKMGMLRVAIAVFALLAIMAVPTAAKTWYVDDSGGLGIDFTSIQDAIDTASAGDTIIVYNGTYHENVKVNQQLNLIGVSMPVVDAGEFGIAINISADGCLLRGFKVVNGGFKHSDAGIYVDSDNNLISDNEAVLNYRHGIYLHYSNNNTISNNNIHMNNVKGIHLCYSNNNTISNNRANSNNDRGISLNYSSSNTLSNNSANENNRDGFHLSYSSYNILLNNNASLNKDAGIFQEHACYNIISNNTVNSNSENGFHLGSSNFNTISNNYANSNCRHGIFLYSGSYNNISDNTANSNCWHGFYLRGSYNTVTNNSANWNREDGIFLGGSSKYNTVSNNNASNNFDDGIYLFDSCYNIISNNNISSNDDGIYFEKSSNNTVSNNNASNNYVGINLAVSPNNIILNNNAHSNKFDGLRIDGSCNNTLSSNNAYLNTKHGIYIFSSVKNLLYHNHLVNNTNSDARDDDGNNQWYNATLCEGNYYSDYTGIDADRDGIGDTPYSIPGSSGSQDLYPMMKHFETKLTVSISTDKYEYSPEDMMNITIRLENPTEIKQRVTFDCYLILPDYNLSYEIMSEERVLTAGFNRSFVIPLDVKYWAPIEFNATWYVTLHNSTTSEIITQSTADWRYSPVTKLRGKLNPSEIAEEIVNKVAEVELPG